MDLRSLRYVLAVADHLSFTAAARHLNVSQPALSQQVRLLEQELGLQLFTRTSHSVVLTRGGELVIDHARRTLAGAARLREEVDAFLGLKRGRLRLAVIQSFAALHLASALTRFVERHPSIDVTVLQWSNPAIMAGIASGSLDLGVAFGPIDESIARQRLYQDRLMLACSPHHPFAAMATVPADAIAGATLALLTHDFGTRGAVDRFLRDHRVAPARIVEVDTFGAIVRLVAAGACISVMPGLTHGDEAGDEAREEAVVFRPLDPAPATRAIYIITPPRAAQQPATTAFARLLADQFAP